MFKVRSSNLFLIIFGLLPSISVVAQETEEVLVPEILITGTPLNRSVSETAQSVTVLSGEELRREQQNNIGETLSKQPGVTNSSFGQNVGRPVIRGLQGSRVGVLNNNMTSWDASSVSQDHAVPTEPFFLDQVEVLRGPATLIYGSGSIGGVVNMVSNAIPNEVPEDGFKGKATLQGDTVADEGFGAASIDFGQGSFAGNISGFYRRADDYEIPDSAELFPDEDEEESTGELENSFLDNDGGSIGGSWIGDSWRAGLSFDDYIFLAGTGGEEDGLPVRVWSQQGAEFTGGELELRWNLGDKPSGNWQIFGFYDQVDAELDDGSNVPLIPPKRFGFGVDWTRNQWKGNVTWIHADDHTDTANFETTTPDYDQVDAELTYRWARPDFDLNFFFKGQNLLDEDIRYSTSSLKDQAPQAGRNFILGVRVDF